MHNFSAKNLGIILLSAFAIALLAGCATADKPALVKSATSMRPLAADGQPANPGAYFPPQAPPLADFAHCSRILARATLAIR